MVGRHRDPYRIDYPFKSIEKDPKEINFDELLGKGENIYVLAHQPGIGKTYNVMIYLKKKIQDDNNFRFFFFTDRHDAIRERIKDWDKDTFCHWRGFENICEDKTAKRLYKDFHFNPSELCKICHKCDTYTMQFKDIKHVFAPFNYLATSHFKENLPNIIFLDESIKQFTSYSSNIEKAQQVFDTLNYMFMTEEGLINIADSLKKKDFKRLSSKRIKFGFIEFYQRAIIEALENESNNKQLLDILSGFNAYDFFEYAKWNSIYGYNLKEYGVPSYYYGAFDAVVNGVPIVFMDATFNQFFFSYLLDSYNGEMRKFREKGFNNLQVQIFKKLHQNKNTVIYRMRPQDTIPKSSFESGERWNRTSKWLSEHMSLIMKIFTHRNVGIIAFEKYANICNAFGLDVEYFGGLRGSNILEDKPVLVIVGAYLPMLTTWDAKARSKTNNLENEEEIKDNVSSKKNKKDYYEDLMRKYFLIEATKDDLKSIEIGAPREVEERFKDEMKLARLKAYTYVGEIGTLYNTPGDFVVKNPAEALNILGWYDEIYQAYHRNRGLIRKNRMIFSYGWFPEPKALMFSNGKEIGELSQFDHSLRYEFSGNIQKISDVDVDGFFNNLLEYNKDGLIEEMIAYKRQHPDATATEIANNFRNYKRGDKRGVDTKTITWLFECIDTIKAQAKYPE